MVAQQRKIPCYGFSQLFLSRFFHAFWLESSTFMTIAEVYSPGQGGRVHLASANEGQLDVANLDVASPSVINLVLSTDNNVSGQCSIFSYCVTAPLRRIPYSS